MATAQGAADLVGLPLVPTADGKLAVFQPPPLQHARTSSSSRTAPRHTVFVCSSPAEAKLWAHAPDRVVDPGVPSWVGTVLASDAVKAATNIRAMGPEHLPDLLASTLPAAWKGKLQVQWQPPPVSEGGSAEHAPEPTRAHPRVEWMRTLWEYVRGAGRMGDAATLCAEWPVLPAVWHKEPARASITGQRGPAPPPPPTVDRVVTLRHLLSFTTRARLIKNHQSLPEAVARGLPRVRCGNCRAAVVGWWST